MGDIYTVRDMAKAAVASMSEELSKGIDELVTMHMKAELEVLKLRGEKDHLCQQVQYLRRLRSAASGMPDKMNAIDALQEEFGLEPAHATAVVNLLEHVQSPHLCPRPFMTFGLFAIEMVTETEHEVENEVEAHASR